MMLVLTQICSTARLETQKLSSFRFSMHVKFFALTFLLCLRLVQPTLRRSMLETFVPFTRLLSFRRSLQVLHFKATSVLISFWLLFVECERSAFEYQHDLNMAWSGNGDERHFHAVVFIYNSANKFICHCFEIEEKRLAWRRSFFDDKNP